jgi:hypothetical protein
MNMKKALAVSAWALFSALACFAQVTNDFFDNTPSRRLTGTLKIEISGEVANPGTIDLKRLPLHTLITREARLGKDGVVFVGAYRVEGYSLLDILNDRVAARRHGSGFRPQTDLMVAVENAAGVKAVLSWGEIYYAAVPHRVLIAASAAPIIPSESKENWPLPAAVKLVCANDLIGERGILNPTRVTLFTAPLEILDRKGLKPLYAPGILVKRPGEPAVTLDMAKVRGEARAYPSVFYGRGRGFHGFQSFAGILLKDALKGFVNQDGETLRRGYLVAVSMDGYRIAMSCSELFNRNDQAEFLLVDRGQGSDGGRYSIFPAADFFSDRALKAVSAIHSLSY